MKFSRAFVKFEIFQNTVNFEIFQNIKNFEILKKIMQKLKVIGLIIPFCEARVCIYIVFFSTDIPFSMHHVKNVMWCYGTHIILHCSDHKTPFDEPTT